MVEGNGGVKGGGAAPSVLTPSEPAPLPMNTDGRQELEELLLAHLDPSVIEVILIGISEFFFWDD